MKIGKVPRSAKPRLKTSAKKINTGRYRHWLEFYRCPLVKFSLPNPPSSPQQAESYLQRCFSIGAVISVLTLISISLLPSLLPGHFSVADALDLPGAILGVIIMLLNLKSWKKFGRALFKTAESHFTETPQASVGREMFVGIFLKLSAIVLAVLYFKLVLQQAGQGSYRAEILSFVLGFFGSLFVGVLVATIVTRSNR